MQSVSCSVYAFVGSLLGGTAARFTFVGCPSDRDEKNLTNLNVFSTVSKTVHKDFKGITPTLGLGSKAVLSTRT